MPGSKKSLNLLPEKQLPVGNVRNGPLLVFNTRHHYPAATMLKTASLISMIALGLVLAGAKRKGADPVNKDFSKGERLSYLAHYGFINAARADVSLDSSLHQIGGKACYKVDVEAKTTGTFSVAYKVEDLWRSYIDTAMIAPQKFYRNIRENKYRLEETTHFRHKEKKAVVESVKDEGVETKHFEIPAYAQDIVSGYYYLRTIEFENFQPGDTVVMDAFFEDKVYDFKILYIGPSVVKTKFGKIKAFEMSPLIPVNDLFSGDNPIRFWVSDDENRVPLKIRAKLFVGAFEIDLVEHKGLKAEFNSL